MELENNIGPDASRGASAHHAPQNAALRATQQTLHAAKLRIAELEAALRRRMNNELNFPPNFERLVLGCIDADFCK